MNQTHNFVRSNCAFFKNTTSVILNIFSCIPPVAYFKFERQREREPPGRRDKAEIFCMSRTTLQNFDVFSS